MESLHPARRIGRRGHADHRPIGVRGYEGAGQVVAQAVQDIHEGTVRNIVRIVPVPQGRRHLLVRGASYLGHRIHSPVTPHVTGLRLSRSNDMQRIAVLVELLDFPFGQKLSVEIPLLPTGPEHAPLLQSHGHGNLPETDIYGTLVRIVLHDFHSDRGMEHVRGTHFPVNGQVVIGRIQKTLHIDVAVRLDPHLPQEQAGRVTLLLPQRTVGPLTVRLGSVIQISGFHRMFPIAVTGRHTHGYGPEEQQTLGHVEIEAILYRTHVVGFPRPHRSLQRRSRHHVLHEQADSHQLHHLRTVQVVRPFGRAHRTIAAVRQSFVLHPPAKVPEEPRFLLEITAYLAYIVNGTVGCFGRILNRYGFPLLSVRKGGETVVLGDEITGP